MTLALLAVVGTLLIAVGAAIYYKSVDNIITLTAEEVAEEVAEKEFHVSPEEADRDREFINTILRSLDTTQSPTPTTTPKES